ncbi:hypothetical protein LTR78_005323 [Recurvomyces mirabilis]|uniref:Rhodopsin domain-containing protein n=1 Tax=Recurvomyces mirabilis TaxID=574656 RepID=A0AAE0WNB6_9PEZI|nr:hypothetical protein LTR78_005323 [Recurvomyces mirabilis]KAK5157874.1 hypothetical protein LTS14_003796 [Recurvomyces mirabilis]
MLALTRRQLFAVGMTCTVMLANALYGWDRHVWDIPTSEIASANKIAFAAKLMFTLAATFTRLSLICFYYRLVKDSGMKWFKYVLHAALLWTLAVGIGFVCMCCLSLDPKITLIIARPVEAYWVFPPTSGHCLDEGKVVLGSGVINCFSDLLTTVLPIPIVARLQMPRRQRFGVCVLLCLGFIVTIAGIVRTYFIWKSLIAQYDETWWAYPLWIAAAVEIDLAVICACAPAWKSLLQPPIVSMSHRLSSKLSSLRSPQSSRRSSPPEPPSKKGLVFSPLRSLPWFQISRLNFEKSQTTSSIEKGLSEDPVKAEDGVEQEGKDVGMREFRHSEITLDPEMGIRPATPSLHIIMRQSVEQQVACIVPAESTHRRSGQWLAEELGMKRLFSSRK